MKKLNILTLVLFCMGISNCIVAATPTGAYDRFTVPVNTSWGTNDTDVYSISVQGGVTVISATDAGGKGKYHSFTYTFPEPIDISSSPSVMVKMKAWWPVDVRIDIQDINGYSSSEYPEVVKTSDDGRFASYEGTYSGATHWEKSEDVDLTKIEKVIFFFNADGSSAYTGNVHIDDLFVGENYPVFDSENFSDGSLDHGWSVYETPVSGTTLYSLEEDPDEELLVASATFAANQYSHYFQYNFYPVDLSDDATIQFDIKSATDITISVDLADVYEKTPANDDPISFDHTGSADFATYSVNMKKYFTYPSTADIERVAYVRFYVNYKGDAFDGTVYLDNIKIGVDPNAGTNQAPIVGTIPKQTIKAGNSFTDLDLNDYITDPDGDNLDWGWDDSDVLNIDISDDGILSVSPKATDWIGSEVLYGYVADSLNGIVSFQTLYSVEDEFPLGSYNNFEDIQQGSWETGNSYYSATIENGATKLSVTAAGGSGNYNATAYEFETPVDLSNGARYFMKIRCADEIDIRIDMEDTEGNSTNADSFFFTPWDDGAFHSVEQEYYSDVTDAITKQKVDMSRIKKLVFYVNPDVYSAYTGDVYFDDILVGEYKHNYRVEEFTDASLDGAWNLDAQYTSATEANNEVTFYADLGEGDYAAVAYDFPALDLSENPYLNISVKSDKDIDVRVDLQDGNGTTTNSAPIVQTLTGDGFYHNLSFDFTGKLSNDMTEIVDSTTIANAIIMFNPGGSAMTANIGINKLEIGALGKAPGNQAPRIKTIEKVSMVTGDSPVTIALANYISDDSTAFADLALDVDIATELSASIANGILKIAIADDTWTGTTIATITATDEKGLSTKYELTVRVSDGAVNPYGYTELFDGMTDSEVTTEDYDTYSMVIVDETLKVTATEAGGSGMYQAVSIDFPNAINITNNRDFSIDIKSAAEFDLRMDLVDANGVVANSDASWVVGYYNDNNNGWFTFSGTFSDVMQNYDGDPFDVTKVAGLMLYVNPDGNNSISADIYFDNIMIGSQTIAENKAPVIDHTLPTEFDIPQGQKTYTIDLNEYVTDETPDNLLKWAVSANTSFDIAIFDGIATITPDYSVWTGAEVVTYTVTDESNESSELKLTLNIGAVNKAPVISEVPEQTKYYKESFADLELDNYVTDETADADITWEISNNTSGYFNADITDRILSVTANQGWSESGVITLTATDEQGLSSTVDITFTVYPSVGNKAPVVSAIENQTVVKGEAFASFSIADYITDETADADIIVRHVNQENLTVGVDEMTVYASVIDSEWYGTETVTFEAVDEEGLRTEFTITFTVKPSADNNAPVLSQIPSQTVLQGEAFAVIHLAKYVEDETPDEDLVWDIGSSDYFDVSITNGIVGIFAKDMSWTGSETIRFTVTDAQGALSSVDVAFTVKPSETNNAPVLSSMPSQTVNQGTSFMYLLLSVYVDDETPDENIQWSVSEATYISATITDGKLTVSVKDANWVGTDSLTLTATDEGGKSTSATIGYTVKTSTSNSAPIITSIPAQTIKIGESFSAIDLSLYVTDETPDSKLVWKASATTNLSVTISENTLSVSVKDAEWTGKETVTLTVADEQNETAEIAVAFTVLGTPENNAPVLSTIPGQLVAQGGKFAGMALAPFVTDETSDDEIVWTVTGTEKLTATIASGALFVSIKDASWTGSETLTLTATDAGGLSSETTVIYSVKATTVNVAPVISAIPEMIVKKGERFDGVDLAHFVTDETADSDIRWNVTGGTKLSPSITKGILSVTVLDADFVGQETFTLTAYDQEGLSATANVLYTIQYVDDENPVLDPIGEITIEDGDELPEIDLKKYVKNEGDGTGLTFIAEGPDELALTIKNGVLSIEPKDENWSGTANITLTVTDASGNETKVSFSFTKEDTTTGSPTIKDIPAVPSNVGGYAIVDLSEYINDDNKATLTYSVKAGDNLKAVQSGSKLMVSPISKTFEGTDIVTVTVTNEKGKSTTKEIVFVFGDGSVNTLEKSATIAMYPNPTSGTVYVDAGKSAVSIQIADVSGTIFIEQQGAEIFTIDVSNLPSGCYIVRIKTDNASSIQTLSVQ